MHTAPSQLFMILGGPAKCLLSVEYTVWTDRSMTHVPIDGKSLDQDMIIFP